MELREVVDLGDRVICDFCGGEYTERPDAGGLLFGSKAARQAHALIACPRCAPHLDRDAKKYGEEQYIRARCPEGKSFAAWVREDLRKGSPGEVRVYTHGGHEG